MASDTAHPQGPERRPSTWPPLLFAGLAVTALVYLLLTPRGVGTVGQAASLSDFHRALESQPSVEAVYYTGTETLVWTIEDEAYSTAAPPSVLGDEQGAIAVAEDEPVQVGWFLWAYIGSFATFLVGSAPIPAIIDVLARAEGPPRRRSAGLWTLALIALPVIGVLLYLTRTSAFSRTAMVTAVVMALAAGSLTLALVGSERVEVGEQRDPAHDIVPG